MRDVTRTELSFITQDCIELRQLLYTIQRNSAAGAIALELAPLVAFFAEESFKYLTAPARSNPGVTLTSPLFETFSESVTKLRARAKLFDDNRGGLNKLIETLALAHQKNSEWFSYPHRGFLGSLKRRLQPDLGIYYFEEHAVCTTHIALLTVGLTYDRLLALQPSEMANVGHFAYEFSVAAGTYLRQLANYLQGYGYHFEENPLPELELPITHNDHHGHLVYSHISDRLGLTQPELSTAILFLLTQINFVERVLSRLLAPTSTLLFRFKFMTAYHATRALQELEEQDGRSGNLLGSVAREILNEPDSHFLLGARQVRNVMAHYELREADRFLTLEGDPLNNVLVGLCHQQMMDVAALAQRQLLHISEAFVAVISKTMLRDSRALLGSHT
jgi:hypothetical protein